MSVFRLLPILLLSTALVWAVSKEEETNAMCSSARLCLGVDIRGCSAEEQQPLSGVTYDNEFCGPFYELRNRGLDPQSAIAREIFRHLGQKYRVIYLNEGVLPVSANMMSYLFDHFPFTTKLVNAYQNTAYFIQYKARDQRIFSGNNGGSLHGDFYWVLQDSAGMYKGFRNVFYGSGGARILRWQLRGIAVAFLDMNPFDEKHVQYKLTAVVFPSNSVLNSIMQMGIFKSVVNDKISEIVQNVAESSRRYAEGDRDPIRQDSALKHPPYREQLAEFERVAGGEPWTIGDAVEIRENRMRMRRPVMMTETPLIFKPTKAEK